MVAKLQAAYDKQVAEIKANQRPTAEMARPVKAISAERPGGARKRNKNKNKAKGEAKQ